MNLSLQNTLVEQEVRAGGSLGLEKPLGGSQAWSTSALSTGQLTCTTWYQSAQEREV